jgi:GTPase SAR1 family protein
MKPTIGIDFLGKNINYKGNTCRLQLWDTAGQ